MHTAKVIVIDPKEKKIYEQPCHFEQGDQVSGMREIIGAEDIIDIDVDGIEQLLTSNCPFIEPPRFTYLLIGQLSAYQTAIHYFEYSSNGLGIGISILAAWDQGSGRFVDCQYTAQEVAKLFRFCGNEKTDYFTETLQKEQEFGPEGKNDQGSTLAAIISNSLEKILLN